jgi:hypothetical protein
MTKQEFEKVLEVSARDSRVTREALAQLDHYNNQSRSKMSVAQKVEFIDKHGRDKFMQLPE